MLERPDAGDAGMPGMLAKFARMQGCWRGCWRLSGAICTVFAVFLEGRATWHQKPVARPVLQAMLRRSLGCNKTRQRYTVRVGLPSLFELEDTAQLDLPQMIIVIDFSQASGFKTCEQAPRWARARKQAAWRIKGVQLRCTGR